MFGFSGILDLVLVLCAVLIAIIAHELSHGLVALVFGDDTAKKAGRLTLNPLAHFDMVGFLMLVLLRFGYAKPVPINPYKFKNVKWGMFCVSIAGITTNLLLAFLCYPLLIPSVNVVYLHDFLVYFIIINVNLAVFNLLPIYPLDGFRILQCFLKSENKFIVFMKKYSQYILIGLFCLGFARDTFNLPAYFDPLSYVIGTCRHFILEGLYAFWSWIIALFV